MPIIEPSSYRAPYFLRNPHAQSILPSLLRRIPALPFERERIATPDDDFLDLDWLRSGSSHLVILQHGLEGNSRRPYMVGMARALREAGYDVLASNFRGCSGEPNRRLRSYHSGASDDLDVVVQHALATGRYDRISLVGFSLGGNITLKYVGERGSGLHRSIVSVVAFSVPCHLRSSADVLARRSNAIYMKRFLATLSEKMRQKAAAYPDDIDLEGIGAMTTFHQFDDKYTAPIHGFRDANDYWERCSSRQFLGAITVPTLLVNALDDPFLSPECFPFEEARASTFFHFEAPEHGGHVGFIARGTYWSERRAVEWIGSHGGRAGKGNSGSHIGGDSEKR